MVTGGDGFIGSKIVQKTGGVSFDIKSGNDILNKEKLAEAIINTDGIFHCAAKISVPESIIVPKVYQHINIDGTKIVIESAVRQKIVFSSSAAVYGESEIPVNEKGQLVPKSPYAETKIIGEELLQKTNRPHVALRYFNVYGPGQSIQYAGVITNFIKKALEGKDLVIHGDGTQVRDFVFISDVVEANIMAMNYNNKKFEIFNIASSEKTTINQLAKLILKLTNSDSKICYEPARNGDIFYSNADISKATNILGWKPKVSLEEGLKETIAFYTNNS